MAEITLTIPWKHLASSNTRNSRRGGRAHGWGYKRARLAIELHAINAVRGERPVWPVGTCEAVLTFYPPDARKRDVLNYVKVLMDGMQGVVYHDDYQVQKTTVERVEPDRNEPRVEVVVWSTMMEEARMTPHTLSTLPDEHTVYVPGVGR